MLTRVEGPPSAGRAVWILRSILTVFIFCLFPFASGGDVTLLPGKSTARSVALNDGDNLLVPYMDSGSAGGLRIIISESTPNTVDVNVPGGGNPTVDGSGNNNGELVLGGNAAGNNGTLVLSVWPTVGGYRQKTYTAQLSTSLSTANYSVRAMLFCDTFSYSTITTATLSGSYAATCQPCAAFGQVSGLVSNSASDCICQPGYHSETGRPPCHLCPVGGNCSVAGTSTSTIPPMSKFLKFPTSTAALLNPRFTKCAVPAACVGGYANAATKSGSKCGRGYTGQLCQECMPKWWKLGWECKSCSSETTPATGFGFAILLYVIFCACLHYYGLIISKVPSIDVVVDYLQVIAILSLFPVDWNSTARDIMSSSSIALGNWQLAQLECAFSTNISWYFDLIPLLMPAACAILYGLAIAAVWLYQMAEPEYDLPSTELSLNSFIHRSFNAFMLQLNLVLPINMLRSFQLISCINGGADGTGVLRFHSDTACSVRMSYEGGATPQIIGIFSALVYVIFVPLSLLAHTRRSFKTEADGYVSSETLDGINPALLTRYRYWWWTAVEHFRRLALCAVAIFWTYGTADQQSATASIAARSAGADVMAQAFAAFIIIAAGYAVEHFAETRRSKFASWASLIALISQYLLLIAGAGLQGIGWANFATARAEMQGFALSLSLLFIPIVAAECWSVNKSRTQAEEEAELEVSAHSLKANLRESKGDIHGSYSMLNQKQGKPSARNSANNLKSSKADLKMQNSELGGIEATSSLSPQPDAEPFNKFKSAAIMGSAKASSAANALASAMSSSPRPIAQMLSSEETATTVAVPIKSSTIPPGSSTANYNVRKASMNHSNAGTNIRLPGLSKRTSRVLTPIKYGSSPASPKSAGGAATTTTKTPAQSKGDAGSEDIFREMELKAKEAKNFIAEEVESTTLRKGTDAGRSINKRESAGLLSPSAYVPLPVEQLNASNVPVMMIEGPDKEDDPTIASDRLENLFSPLAGDDRDSIRASSEKSTTPRSTSLQLPLYEQTLGKSVEGIFDDLLDSSKGSRE